MGWLVLRVEAQDQALQFDVRRYLGALKWVHGLLYHRQEPALRTEFDKSRFYETGIKEAFDNWSVEADCIFYVVVVMSAIAVDEVGRHYYSHASFEGLKLSLRGPIETVSFEKVGDAEEFEVSRFWRSWSALSAPSEAGYAHAIASFDAFRRSWRQTVDHAFHAVDSHALHCYRH